MFQGDNDMIAIACTIKRLRVRSSGCVYDQAIRLRVRSRYDRPRFRARCTFQDGNDMIAVAGCVYDHDTTGHGSVHGYRFCSVYDYTMFQGDNDMIAVRSGCVYDHDTTGHGSVYNYTVFHGRVYDHDVLFRVRLYDVPVRLYGVPVVYDHDVLFCVQLYVALVISSQITNSVLVEMTNNIEPSKLVRLLSSDGFSQSKIELESGIGQW
ncbi:hypothetical protein TREMEDRAFT_65074 [Tremella mesenterica DSM 1558]|uniref:uncharacterized protein n=1 Tax=Tremella mesenterica (strain ATCC 24925 / CBS 8224 / DSM 1558 / NBRC 9311 / NRRL Y-6157 / RJB 2259-6 / UBC 559-6) TaxID=578456 RepID=UPI00032C2E95|nr:uncharacterized protein TREMEDRAFT_65074 [Tremella mesenterica DSM 1558]EIW66682.1 hypothetical protein TREMEDRAFT_65074 [Tremella mesenterica DSM 1558]